MPGYRSVDQCPHTPGTFMTTRRPFDTPPAVPRCPPMPPIPSHTCPSNLLMEPHVPCMHPRMLFVLHYLAIKRPSPGQGQPCHGHGSGSRRRRQHCDHAAGRRHKAARLTASWVHGHTWGMEVHVGAHGARQGNDGLHRDMQGSSRSMQAMYGFKRLNEMPGGNHRFSQTSKLRDRIQTRRL